MKLGCKPPHPDVLITVPRVRIGTALDQRCDREALISAWMARGIADYRNGSILGRMVQQPEFGSCTCAALAHAAVGASLVFSGGDAPIPQPPEFNVIQLFGDVAGLPSPRDDAQLAGVAGLDPTDVLRHAIRRGFDAGLEAPLVPRPGRLDMGDVGAVSGGILNGGGVYAAFDLYQADEDALAAGRALDVAGEPGTLVGGHMMLLYDFPGGTAENAPVRIVTYDGVVVAPWAWVLARAVCGFVLHWTAPVMPADAPFEVGAWEV